MVTKKATKKTTKRWYTIQYFDKGNSMTYRTPVQAVSKATALAKFGTPAQRKQHMSKVKVTLFK
jgi:hypothetical protein